ncbi:MAG: hypothetical protein K6L80_12105 [Agarilytica sp.]
MSKNIIFLLAAALVVSAVSAIILGQSISSAAGIGFVIGMAAGTVGIAAILAFIPAGIYWLFKRKRMPGLNITIWVLWGLIAVLSLVGNLM